MWHLFLYLTGNPRGGLNDFWGSFSSFERTVYAAMDGSQLPHDGEIGYILNGRLVEVAYCADNVWYPDPDNIKHLPDNLLQELQNFDGWGSRGAFST